MIYSYTQISQYLTCPRRYRHRYLDRWREKDTPPAMLFGRPFDGEAPDAAGLVRGGARLVCHWRTAGIGQVALVRVAQTRLVASEYDQNVGSNEQRNEVRHLVQGSVHWRELDVFLSPTRSLIP